MIRVAVEIRERAVVRRVRITAESIERALELCNGKAHVISLLEPFFAQKDATGPSERCTKLAA
jgi:hypothetical protein